MRILFIGGTGNISRYSSLLARDRGYQLTHLNRGNQEAIPGIKTIQADVNNKEQMETILSKESWDVVVNWILFTPDQAKRDIKLFSGKTGQYVFISSASAYEKPPKSPIITESTPLTNPYWEYSQNKIISEDVFMQAFRKNNFPVTIVRPSLTYDRVIPAAIGSWQDYTVIDRIKNDLPIIVHGDGTSLWTITHSRDFAKGFIGLIGHPQSIGESYHITSDELLTWTQIYDIMGQTVNKNVKKIYMTSETISKLIPSTRGTLLGDKAYSAIFDNSKIKKIVPDFCANIPFWKGFRETIEWFESDSKHQKISKENNALLNHLAKYNSELYS